MTKLNLPTMITMLMLAILISCLMYNKTSIQCIHLVLFILMMSVSMSLKIKLSPIPFIIFLTMIGGLMIIFLYLTATLWIKKENGKSKMMSYKIILPLMTLLMPMPILMNSLPSNNSNNNLIMFNLNFNNMTMMLIIFLAIILVYVAEIHMKANNPFRRKLKIWG